MERACGLKTAVEAAAERRPELRFAAEAGPTSCLRFWLSWEAEAVRRTRWVARSFCPEFFHHCELPCDLRSLAERLATGRLELRLVHHEAGHEEAELGRAGLPLGPLLLRDGPLRLTLPLAAKEGEEAAVAAVEVAVGFAGGAADRKRVLQAGNEAGFGAAEEAIVREDAEEAEEPWGGEGEDQSVFFSLFLQLEDSN